MSIKDTNVTPRGDVFAERLKTRITAESPSDTNPYLTARRYTHGYELEELSTAVAFDQMIFLLLRGDLPNAAERRLFNALLVSFANPGIRDPAVRAAVTAAASKTEISSLLPISATIAGGSVGGGAEVSNAMRFIRRHRRRDPLHLAAEVCSVDFEQVADRLVAPGFGSTFGAIDPMAKRMAVSLANRCDEHPVFTWCERFVEGLTEQDASLGWRWWGVCAAALLELGFHPRTGVGIYQVAVSAGALAHGLEWRVRAYTDLPFVPEDDYILEGEEREPR